jgi:zinc D-Ala-D-Ala carboxypeptidase
MNSTDLQLSKNFYLSEFTKSQTAIRFGIKNEPDEKETQNLRLLCQNVLQPVRDRFGIVSVSSGFRSFKLNQKVSRSPQSQHRLGQAADFEIFGVSNVKVADWIAKNLPFDQLILEFYDGVNPNSGWVHCSFGSRDRREYLTTADGRNYLPRKA